MAKLETAVLAFNRGLISPRALARVDLKRTAWSAEEMTNWIAREFGSMMLRPGFKYRTGTNGNLTTRNLPFVRSASAKAVLELTADTLRVLIDDAPITREAVSSAVSNGDFTTDLASWTDNDESGAASVWVAGGYMGLTGTGTLNAIRDQTVTVSADDTGVEHALRIVVERGPVTLRVGTGTGGDFYIGETELATGTHSLAFTPVGNFSIRFMSSLERQVLVSSCNVEAAGIMTLPTPWGASDLDNVRAGTDTQSVDVMFVACTGYTQRRIERRGTRSWSVVQYLANDGPFRNLNTGPITITPSALSGNITLTASAALFQSTQAPSADNAGALFRITSEGQQVQELDITAQNTFSDAIRVTGVDNSRIFTVTRANLGGTGSTATLQRSLESDAGPWEDFASYTTNGDVTVDDGLDNQIVWYRIGVKTGDYAGGTIDLTLTYQLGSIDGIVRITAFSSSTSVSAEVIQNLGGTDATPIWEEGAWSDYRGWPSAGALYESRLWWAGLDKQWGSVVDAFDSFDDRFEGDAGPISRSIGSGPLEVINWIVPLQRLMLGGQLAEFAARSSSFDEPLTPTNFNIKKSSTQGSSNVQGMALDDTGVFVQRGGTRLFSLEFNAENYNYRAKDLCNLIPEIGKPRIVRIVIQRQPDTRIHCILSNGKVAILVFDEAENVACWLRVETDGWIEDGVVLPGDAGTDEDQVYYTVRRTINGSTVRYYERWALESSCKGGTSVYEGTSTATITDLPYDDTTVVTVRDADGEFIENATVSEGAITLSAAVTYAQITPAKYLLADSFVEFDNGATPSVTVTGLGHLIGEEVVVYQDGICPEDSDGFPETYTVSVAGEVTLDTEALVGMVGLPYEARWKSAKISVALNYNKKIDYVGVVLGDTHAKGLYFGPTFDELDALPEIEEGYLVDENSVHREYDEPPIEFDGDWDSDSRLCLQAYAPRPCTVMAATVTGEIGV